MKVNITGWKCLNLRGGLRTVNIDLGVPPRRWTLVQIPNGLGKTTTMELLRYGFTGAAMPPEFVQGLRADDNVESGQFELRLTIDDKPCRVVVDFDFATGAAEYSTARASTRSGGLEPGWLLPEGLRDLLKRPLVELFIFDGELATEIRAVGKDRATTAIEALYRLDPINTLGSQIDRLVEEEFKRVSSISTAREESALRRLKTEYDSARTTLARLTSQQQQFVVRQSTLTRRSAEILEAIDAIMASDQGLLAQRQELDNQIGSNRGLINESIGSAIDSLRTPASISPLVRERLQMLGEQLYTLKLPESISREFFTELAMEELCVCGRPISEHERTAIVSRAGRYLAEDQISVINQMKLALRDNPSDGTAYVRECNELSERLRLRQSLKHQKDKLERDRIEGGDDRLANLRNELEAANAELKTLSEALERLSTKDPDRQKQLRLGWENNVPLCQVMETARKNRLETASNTRRFARRAEKLGQIVGAIRAKALSLLRERVRLATNQKLAQIIKNEDLQVDRISGRLEVSSDRVHSKADLSEGQNLAVAYAFLTSLLEDAPYKLPFVVDSPAVSLDVQVRREVGQLIPEFFDQMIMFVISSERQGFADTFYSRPSDEVTYLTIAPLGNGAVDIQSGEAAFREFHGRDIP
ncbi:MAG: hypothetical protein V4574_11125 [Pseudomonadota bacterium]